MAIKVLFEGNKVYIDGELAVKKRLPKNSHCRDIYLTSKYVLKMAKNEEDFDQSIKENYTWKRLAKKDRVYFAEPLDINTNGRYIIFKRVVLRTIRRTEADERLILNLAKNIEYGM